MNQIKNDFSFLDNPMQKKIFANGKDYTNLLKIRVMSLVVFTALTGLIVAPGHIHPVLGIISLICIAVGGGAAGALNMWYDSDIDALMKRTKNRPIPSGRIHKDQAFVFGISLSVLSVMTMGIFINWFSAFFLAFTIFFYVVIYTMWLKRRTPQNIVIGGASGAFPPMIGWSAVTGNISIESVILFLIIFLWTPPHFWALSLFTKTDYDAAKIPMLPNIKGVKETQKQCLIYSLLMSVTAILPFILGFAGILYGFSAILLGIIFIKRAYSLWRTYEKEEITREAKKLFYLSLFYLSILFCILLFETLFCRFITNATCQ